MATVKGLLAYGAKGDGVTDDTLAIQAAVIAGDIAFWPGTFVISSQILVPSNRRILLDPGTILFRKAGTGQQNSLVLNNANFWMNSDPLNGNENIWIEGGTYDGNQSNQTPIDYGNTSRFCGGVGMRFLNVKNLRIKSCRFQNNISFQIQVGNINKFLIEDVDFVFSGSAVHQDGVHVNGPASLGVIRNILSNGGNDSLIALNADDAIFGAMTDGGDISNILVDNLTSTSQLSTPYEGSAIMLLKGPHSISDVVVRGVHGRGFQADTVIDLETFEGVGDDTGTITRVLFEDFDVGTPRVNDGFCQCSQNIGDITFRNCRWYPGMGTADTASTYQCFFRQASGTAGTLVFDGIQIIGHNNPGNTPFVFGNSTAVLINNLFLARPGVSSPSGYLLDTSGVTIGTLMLTNAVGDKLAGWVFGGGVHNLSGNLLIT